MVKISRFEMGEKGMKTYLRYSLHVCTMKYPFKTPEAVQNASKELQKRCKKYEIENAGGVLLIPTDVEEYSLVLEFRKKYAPYTEKFLMYERVYTKKEMDSAEYYLLRCNSVIANDYKPQETFTTCCEYSNFYNEQIGNYKIKTGDMKSKVIAFTYDYRFIVANAVKAAWEEQGMTNVEYIPVYGKKNMEVAAYQIACKQQMKPLAELNGWSVYYECEHCHKIYWNPIHEVPHSFYIPLSWKEQLADLNATYEMFTNVGSRYYVISRRLYNELVLLGARKLKCEPVTFIE